MRDSCEKGADIRDQDSFFQTLVICFFQCRLLVDSSDFSERRDSTHMAGGLDLPGWTTWIVGELRRVCWSVNIGELVLRTAVRFLSSLSLKTFVAPFLQTYPGYQRFFIACDGELRLVYRRPTRVRSKAEETRAWKASGTQGTPDPTDGQEWVTHSKTCVGQNSFNFRLGHSKWQQDLQFFVPPKLIKDPLSSEMGVLLLGYRCIGGTLQLTASL